MLKIPQNIKIAIVIVLLVSALTLIIVLIWLLATSNVPNLCQDGMLNFGGKRIKLNESQKYCYCNDINPGFMFGCNFTGWLVMEDWMFPTWENEFSSVGTVASGPRASLEIADEFCTNNVSPVITPSGWGERDMIFTMYNKFGGNQAAEVEVARVMRNHWNQFLLNDHINIPQKMRSLGHTHVRIPVPYYLVEEPILTPVFFGKQYGSFTANYGFQSEGFITGAANHLYDMLVELKKQGIKAIISIQNLPGGSAANSTFAGAIFTEPMVFTNRLSSTYVENIESVSGRWAVIAQRNVNETWLQIATVAVQNIAEWLVYIESDDLVSGVVVGLEVCNQMAPGITKNANISRNIRIFLSEVIPNVSRLFSDASLDHKVIVNFVSPQNDPSFLKSLIDTNDLNNVTADYHSSFNKVSVIPATGESMTYICDPSKAGGTRCLSDYINLVWSDIAISQEMADKYKTITSTFIGDFNLDIALNWSNNYMILDQVGCCDPVSTENCNLSHICLPLGPDPNYELTKIFLSQFYRLQIANIFSKGFTGALFKSARTGSGWSPFLLNVVNPQEKDTAFNMSKQASNGYQKDSSQNGPPRNTNVGWALQIDNTLNYDYDQSGYLWWTRSIVELDRLQLIPKGLDQMSIQNACDCKGCDIGYDPNPSDAQCDIDN
jgi:hypothetical protein